MIKIKFLRKNITNANVFVSLLFLAIVFSIGFLSSVQAAPPGMVDVTFEFKPSLDSVKTVHLAGSFNDWSTTATPMKDENNDGYYEVTIPLKPGEYTYKFVINGNRWMRDPNNDKTVPDGFGGVNSVLEVELDKGSKEKAKIGDGKIFADSIWHNPDKRDFLNRITEERVAFRLQTKRHDINSAELIYKDETGSHTVDLEKYTRDENYTFWRKEIDIKGKNVEYAFRVYDKGVNKFYGLNGPSDKEDDYFKFDLSKQVVFKTPDWVKEAVFYQIFPDRFYNGNKENDPELIETYKNNEERYKNYTPDWHQGITFTSHHYIDPEKFTDDSGRIYPKSGWHVFYGGDLQGVEKKFDYLKELGINAIYFNPIFEATANHRYNIAAYEKIDDNLAIKGDFAASEEYFEEFIKKAHKNGIKIVLDAVFNHSGYEHYAFQDIVENGKDSEYWDWYFVEEYPINTLYEQRTQGKEPNYKCWAGFGAHPKLNVANPEVKQYIFDITKKWMDPDGDGDPSDGIDGWRLDVANEVRDTDPDFWEEWRKMVKELNPDIYITGEIWNNASRYLQGKEFDAVMNYKFRDAVVNFIAEENLSAEQFINNMNVTNIDYPVQSIYALQNLIDSHDTVRFLASASRNKDKLKLAALLQFTYPGAPMIYYGDEVGLFGGRDPDNRRTMIWEERPNGKKPDKDLYNYYSKLADIRKNENSLIEGSVSFSKPANTRKAVIMTREYKDEKLYILLNAFDNSQKFSFSVDESYQSGIDLLSEKKIKIKNGKANIKVESYSGMIIKLK